MSLLHISVLVTSGDLTVKRRGGRESFALLAEWQEAQPMRGELRRRGAGMWKGLEHVERDSRTVVTTQQEQLFV